MTTTRESGIARRENGLPPPDVPLTDIERGLRHVATGSAGQILRRAHPPRFRGGARTLGTDHVRPCPPGESASGGVQLGSGQYDIGGHRSGRGGVRRFDDRPGRPAPSAPAVYRQPGVHPEDGGADRRERPDQGAQAGRRFGGESPGRAGRLRRGRLRTASAADHLRHDGHPRRGRTQGVSLDDRASRCRRRGSGARPRRAHRGGAGTRRLRHGVGRGPSCAARRRPDDQPGAGRRRR